MKRVKHILFGVLLIVIWMPFVQMVFPVMEAEALKGAFVPHAKPTFTDSTWFRGDFQRAYEQYLNDTIGFHQDFIRLRNQIDFSLFDKCHSYDIEVGKKGYLVATWHIDSHLGKLRARETQIDSLAGMLKQVNDSLIKMNKTLIVIFAPSRGSFYKELAPNWYDLTPVHESDYQRYTRLLAGSRVKCLDFNKAFLLQKQTSKYPLYTKCGVHWSSYGAAIATDSLVKFIEKERQVDLPDITTSKIELSDSARGADADLNSTLNLIWPVKNEIMAYPKFSFNKTGKAKLKLLTIGDSYYFGMLENKIPDNVFEENSFWYYNNSIYTNGPNMGKTVKDVSLKDEIGKHDVIAIIATESTLIQFGWGFIEKAWLVYCTPKGDRIAYYIDKIKNDPAWYGIVKQKAQQYNKTIEAQLQDDANYAVELERK